jgi:protein ImuB
VLKATGPERIEAEWWRTGKGLGFLLPPRDPEKPDAPPQDIAKKKVIVPRLDEHVSALPTFDAQSTVCDYYMIEDEAGRRFWVFRLGLYGAPTPPSWYLHGFFA